MAKAFLYSGIVFLIMISTLVAANYMLISKHSVGKMQASDLEVDTFLHIGNNLEKVLATDVNNTVADAVSDAAFYVLTLGAISPIDICQNLQYSGEGSIPVVLWVENYTNVTMRQIESLIPQISIDNISFNFAALNCIPTETNTVKKLQMNISATLLFNISLDFSNTQIIKNITFNKTLNIMRTSPPNQVSPTFFDVNVTDMKTKRTDFNKNVMCVMNQGCSPY